MTTPAVTPNVDNDDPFAKFANPSQNQPAATTPTADNDDPFAKFAAPQAPQQLGPSQEEQELLKNNPTYKYLPKDPRFPNREPGVYPMGAGNEWRNNPDGPMATTTQAPIDPHLLKHTLQGAGYGALAAGSALAAPLVAAADPVITTVVSHLDKLKTIVDYAEKIGLRGLEYEGARKLYKDLTGDGKK